jgi:hypothetical protein
MNIGVLYSVRYTCACFAQHSANFVPEVESSSRTIAVRGTRMSSVVVGDEVPRKAVHVNAHVHHRSFLALADSGAAVSCVNTTTYDTIRRRCPGTPLVHFTKPFSTYVGKLSRCMGMTVLPVTLGSFYRYGKALHCQTPSFRPYSWR